MTNKITSLVICLLATCFLNTALAVKLEDKDIAGALQTEDAFAAVAELAKPAVVVITNKQKAPAFYRNPQMQLPPDLFRFFFGVPQHWDDDDDAPYGWREYPNNQLRRKRGEHPRQRKPQGRPVGKGSGVLFRADGYLLTNCHVIKDSDYLEVKTLDGTVYDNEKDPDAVKIIGMDPETDLAVLQIGNGQKTDFHCLEFADSDKLRAGQWAIAIGAPFNFDYSLSIGCISQRGRHDTGMSIFEDYIQTDADINPGNSGGPLLNIRGQIIGINQFIYSNGTPGSIGLGFAISSNLASQVANSLVEHGSVKRAFLGISMQELSEKLKAFLNAEYGVVVGEVLEGKAAQKAGVKNGDVILKIGDQKVESTRELLLAVSKYQPGDKITATLLREGKEITVTVKADERPTPEIAQENVIERWPAPTSDDLLNRLGLQFTDNNDQLIITDIDPDGLAAAAGNEEDALQPGDIILAVNHQEVHNLQDLRNILSKSDANGALLFYVQRKIRNGKYKFFLAIPLAEDK